MTFSVYWIRHKDHTDVFRDGYIGVSQYAEKRFDQHFKRTQNRHLKFAIQKYGWGNLIKQKLLVGEEQYCLDIERKLRPEDAIGWNLVAGGGLPPTSIGNQYRLGKEPWNKGKKMAAETIEKVRQAAKEQWQREGMREILSNAKKGKLPPMAGKKHTPESIEKMRLTKIGKTSKRKGLPVSAEIKQKLLNTVRACHWTCPHCQKSGYSQGAANRWHFNNCKGAK